MIVNSDRLDWVRREAKDKPSIVTTQPFGPPTVFYQIRDTNFEWIVTHIKSLREQLAVSKE